MVPVSSLNVTEIRYDPNKNYPLPVLKLAYVLSRYIRDMCGRIYKLTPTEVQLLEAHYTSIEASCDVRSEAVSSIPGDLDDWCLDTESTCLLFLLVGDLITLDDGYDCLDRNERYGFRRIYKKLSNSVIGSYNQDFPDSPVEFID